MKINQFLSKNGQRIRMDLNLSDGPPEWGLKAKNKAKLNPTLINATIGSARDEKGLSYLPTLLNEIQKLPSEEILGYANMRGVPSFVKAWKEDTINSYPPNFRNMAKKLTSDPVPVAGGLTGALFTAGQMFFDKGTQMLAPSLRWGNVDNCLRISLGATIHSFNLFDENGRFSFNQLRSKITEMTSSASRLILYLNFPNNPGGYMPSFIDIEKLQNILKAVSVPIIILLDDAYEGYTYKNGDSALESPIPHSIFPYLLSLNENVVPVKIDGPSKRFCAYGTRLGMISIGFHSEDDVIADFELRKEGLNISEAFTKAARGRCSSAPRGIQEALSRILSNEDKYKSVLEERKALKTMLEQRYHCLLREIQKQDSSSILKPLDFNSGFFGFYSVQGISAKTLAEQLLENGLGVVPFENKQTGINGVRFAFCSVLEKDIPQAIEILWRVSKEIAY